MANRSIRQVWRCWAVIAWSFGIGLSLQAHAEGTLEKIKRTNTLVIAYLNGTMPFAFLNEDKQVTGYAIDLCRKIAEGIRKDFKLPQMQVQFMEVDTVTRFIALDQNKADLECSTSTNNAERRKIAAFTVPHFFSTVRMLVKADSEIRNWDDLRGRTIVVPRNTPMVKLVQERSDIRSLGVKIVEVARNEDAFNSVVAGKGDAEFKRYVDLQMVKIIRSGEIFKIYDRWFTQPLSATVPAMGMPMGYILRDTLRYPTDKVGDE